MHKDPSIRLMFAVSLGYFLCGSVLVLALREDPAELIAQLFTLSAQAPSLFVIAGWQLLLPVALAFVLLVPRAEMAGRLMAALLAVFLCGFLFFTFTMVKTTLPFAVPFWSDRLFADLDAALFRTDPWRLTHGLMPGLDIGLATTIYSGLWLLPAMFLPVLSRLFDPDPARRQRFLVLYCLVWIVLGNVLAFAFSSAGPVYYMAVLGDPRFVPLTDRLAASGQSGAALTALQAWLWDAYATGGQRIGSGISAFPSVHVAMVTVIALYLVELRRWLWPLSVLLVAVYLVLSVHLAWHYAVDGLASILAVLAMARFLRRGGAGGTA